jgi:hypothetical protein
MKNFKKLVKNGEFYADFILGKKTWKCLRIKSYNPTDFMNMVKIGKMQISFNIIT